MSSEYPSTPHEPSGEGYPAMPGGSGGAVPPQPTPAGEIPGRKGPLAVLLSGIGAGVLGFILLLAGAFSGIGSLVSAAEDQQQLPSGEPSVMSTEADTTYGIFVSGSATIQCYAENGDGVPVEIRTPGYHGEVSNREQVLVMETGPSDTSVTILCETDNELDYYVGETVGSSIGGMAAPAIAGVLLMGIGGVLVIAGIIWLVIRQGQIKRARAGS